jgi:hypothetical protein
MRRFAAGLLPLFLLTTMAHADGLPGIHPVDLIFAGCVQGTDNCVNAILTGVPGGAFDYTITATFGSGGGWIFNWDVFDSRAPDFVSEVGCFDTIYGNGTTFDAPHASITFTGKLPSQVGIPTDWAPDRLEIALFQHGRDTGSIEKGFNNELVPARLSPAPQAFLVASLPAPTRE